MLLDKKHCDMLTAAYMEPCRHYHNLSHIGHCLTELSRNRDLAEYPDEVELAIMFHDFVYDPKADDNEERSAAKAVEVMRELKLPEISVQRVYDEIMATKRRKPEMLADAWLMLDIDLAIWGQPNHIYDEYERNIRKEYSWVSVDDYVKARSMILKSCADAKRIYHNDCFEQKYGAKARENLQRALEGLKKLCPVSV